MKKYSTLLSLYLAQSIPMSFFTSIIPVIMRQENYSLTMIGLLQLIKLPWIFKFLWAPVVDRYSNSINNYKRWIFSSEIIYALAILSIGFFDLRFDFQLIIVLILIAITASATQDIATDAFAIRILNKKERSLGNSMQSAGSFLGTMVGSGLLLIVYHNFGWNGLLMSLAGFVIIALIPLRLYKHRAPEVISDPEMHKDLASLKDIGLFFRQKGIIRRVVLLFIFYSGITGILALMKPFLVDQGFNVKEIGMISGIYGTAGAVVSSVAAGFIIRAIGRRNSLYLFAFLNLLTTLFFIWMLSGNTTIVSIYIAVMLLWVSYGMSSVAVFTISMDVVRHGREGTDFTLQIVITHLSGLIITIISGGLADIMGYHGLFIIETILACLVILSIPVLYREKLAGTIKISVKKKKENQV